MKKIIIPKPKISTWQHPLNALKLLLRDSIYHEKTVFFRHSVCDTRPFITRLAFVLCLIRLRFCGTTRMIIFFMTVATMLKVSHQCVTLNQLCLVGGGYKIYIFRRIRMGWCAEWGMVWFGVFFDDGNKSDGKKISDGDRERESGEVAWWRENH